MFLRAEEGMRGKTEKRLRRGSGAWGKRDGDVRYGGSVRVAKQAIAGRGSCQWAQKGSGFSSWLDCGGPYKSALERVREGSGIEASKVYGPDVGIASAGQTNHRDGHFVNVNEHEQTSGDLC